MPGYASLAIVRYASQVRTPTLPCFSVRTWFHDKGLIINNATMFYMLDTRFINGQGGRVPYMVTSSIISTFTVNAHSRLIYFADAKTNSLYELNLFTHRYRLVTSTAPAAGNNPKPPTGMSSKFELWSVPISKMRYCFILSNADILSCNKTVQNVTRTVKSTRVCPWQYF